MNDDAIDDAEREWMKAHGVANDAAEKASEAWTKYNRMAQGKPIIKSQAKPKQTLQVMPSGSGMGPMMAIMQRMKQ